MSLRPQVRRTPQRAVCPLLAVCLLWSAAGPPAAFCFSNTSPIGASGALRGPEEAASPQEVSSFYIRLFESGQKAFNEKRYRDAAGDLEIAVFGLANDKILYGKAQLYLAICFNYLALRSKVEPALTQAARFLGSEDVKALALDEEVLSLLRKLVESFRVDLEIPPPPGSVALEAAVPEPPPVSSKPPEKATPPLADLVFVQKTEESKPPADPPPPETKAEKKSLPDVKILERRLKSEAGNPVLVEELVSLYFKNKEPKKAKAVLERYLLSQPNDLAAVFSIARANYFLREYRAAMDGLQTVSTPAAEASQSQETNVRIAIYKALCLFALGQESSAAAYLNYVTASVGPEDLSRLIKDENLGTPWAVLVGKLKRSFLLS